MKRRIIIALCSIMLVLCSISVGFTVAWLTFSDTKKVVYSVGDVEYEIDVTSQAENSDRELIVPSDEESIFSNLVITNNSNVTTNLRIRFEITETDHTWTVGTTDDCEILVVLNSINEESDEPRWIFSTTENNVMYYYTNQGDSDQDIEPLGSISTAISGVYLNGKVVKNDHSDLNLTLKLIVEAKQAEAVEWNEIADFITGMPVIN